MRWTLILILALFGCEGGKRFHTESEIEAIASDVARGVTAEHPRVEILYRRTRELEDRVTELERDRASDPTASRSERPQPEASNGRYELIAGGTGNARRVYASAERCEAAKQVLERADQAALVVRSAMTSRQSRTWAGYWQRAA